MIPIVIPFYKAKDKLDKCIEHINAQNHVDTEVFIRDNSLDNILYTRAINEGIKHFLPMSTQFILVLTQDAYMDSNCLLKLIDAASKNERGGIFCPIQHSGGRVTWGGSGQAWPGGQHTFSNTQKPFKTYWANGACMLIRTEMIKEIGLFDQNMRFICSDSDYSFTARSRGWQVIVVPEANCEHELDGSGKAGVNEWLDVIKIQDLIYFTNKWLSGGLYRQLSLEGKTLTPTKIRSQIHHWENYIKKLVTSNPGLASLTFSAGQVSQISL